MTVTCEYCNEPVDERSLVHKSKACLVPHSASTGSRQKFQCSHCGKCLSGPTCLQTHKATCIKRLENDIADLKHTIASQALEKDKIVASLKVEITSLEAKVADLEEKELSGRAGYEEILIETEELLLKKLNRESA